MYVDQSIPRARSLPGPTPRSASEGAARLHSSFQARFMQADPLGYEDGPNFYGYVGGDPVNGKDPTGLWQEENDRKEKGLLEGVRDLGKRMVDLVQEAGNLLLEGANIVGEGAALAQDGLTDIADSITPDSVWQSERAQVRSLEGAERSLEANVVEHKEKLRDWRANPDAHDNKGTLARATTPEMRSRIIEGRARSLEAQIRKNQGELNKVRRALEGLRRR